MPPLSPGDIRVATNQAPPLVGHNVVTSDLPLVEAVTRHAGADVVEDLTALGAEAGTAEAREHGMLANRHHPELTPYDRYGNRVDEVTFHPSWHWLMERAVGHGLAAAALGAGQPQRPRAPRRRLHGLVAHRAGPRLPGLDDVRRGPRAAGRPAYEALAKEWTPLLASTSYDPGVRLAAEKRGALAGMGMTEKQGGSDVRANVTEARPDVGRRRVHPARAQVVHVRADERRVPGAGPGRRRA